MVQKISALIDKFTYASLDPGKWTLRGETPTVVNKKLKLLPGEGIQSTSFYDFTNSQAYAQVIREAEAHFLFKFKGATGDSIAMETKDNQLVLEFRHNGVSNNTVVPYDSKTQLYWRMRERLGVVYWETSPDGANWALQRMKPHDSDLTSGQLLIMNSFGSGFGYGPVDLGFGFGPFGGP